MLNRLTGHGVYRVGREYGGMVELLGQDGSRTVWPHPLGWTGPLGFLSGGGWHVGHDHISLHIFCVHPVAHC